jgi:GNAT-family acetyltransferase (TIGR03103 family)
MKANASIYNQRLLRGQAPSYERLQARFAEDGSTPDAAPLALHCGWGRLLIGHTYPDPAALAHELLNEKPGERDIALYVAAPQQVLAQSPQQLFLDPSDTLRLWFSDYRPSQRVFRGFRIRRAQSQDDWTAINNLYIARGMLPIDPALLTPRHQGGPVYWIAEDETTNAVIGSVMGLNHQKAFNDPENGSSLWCLAVDPQCTRPGVGEVLVRHLIEHFQSRGLAYLDLSVLHDNQQAKNLYAKLGFRNLPTFAIKRKNGINEKLFLGPGPEADFNPYARIIVEEAHRRGIDVQVDDAEAGLFTLIHGGRRIRCRESLSDLTTAVSMTLCQDKRLTNKVLKAAGLELPVQQLAGNADDNLAFLDEHERVVVKPVDGEQGQGVAVDLRTIVDVQAAVCCWRAFMKGWTCALSSSVLMWWRQRFGGRLKSWVTVVTPLPSSSKRKAVVVQRPRVAKARFRWMKKPVVPLRTRASPLTACCLPISVWRCAARPICTPGDAWKT